MRYSILVFIVLLSDFISKLLVLNYIPKNSTIKLLSFLNLTNIINYGLSFGLFNNASNDQFSLIFCAVIVISLILYFFRKTNPLSVSLITGGAIGNTIDRILYGGVVDFIHLHYKHLHFPAFNLADSFIVIGVFLIIFLPDVSNHKNINNR